MTVTPHSANRSMVTLFTMHFLKALPNGGNYLELSIEGEDVYSWEKGLFAEPVFSVEDGCVTVPDRPGWGVTVDPEWLARAEYRVSSSS